ncbi:MAG: alginate lyase family protein, partial [Lentisphaerae bacterium]|nr:alginate lyase family protein [Lentisphaerota bacterium]
MFVRGLSALLILSLFCGLTSFGVELPDKFPENPFIACNRVELELLKKAYKSDDKSVSKVVEDLVKAADKAIEGELKFPPRGGQHNTFYQCKKCQTALVSLSETRHQCPICKKEYSGYPYDDVIFKRQHGSNLARMLSAAWGYAITDELKYAEFAATVLKGYAERYMNYPFHGSTKGNVLYNALAGGRLYEQTLSEASGMTLQIAPAYDLIYNSGVLSESDKKEIRDKLFVPILKNLAKHNTGINNWQSWHNAAMVTAGALIHDKSWVDRGINDSKNGFLFQLKKSLTPDGLWYESSWGYHFYALQALTASAEAARRLGMDLWDSEDLKKMFTLPTSYTMANGSLPRFGDDVDTNLSRFEFLMEIAYNAYKDPVLLGMVSDKPSLHSIIFDRQEKSTKQPTRPKSLLLEGAGHALLHSAGDAGLSAALSFGGYGGYHGHLDKLSFVFYGYRSELAVDPGRAASQAYRLPIHTEWYKATLSHNAIVVDGASQRAGSGKALLFGSSPEVTAVLAECNSAYRGVDHRRMLVLTPDYLLVVDFLKSTQRRK